MSSNMRSVPDLKMKLSGKHFYAFLVSDPQQWLSETALSQLVQGVQETCYLNQIQLMTREIDDADSFKFTISTCTCELMCSFLMAYQHIRGHSVT